MLLTLVKYSRLIACALVVLFPYLTLEDGSTSLRGRSAAHSAPLRVMQEAEEASRLGGRPALGDMIDAISNDTQFSAVTGNCGIAVVDFPSGDLAVAHCTAETIVLQVAKLEPEKFSMTFMQNVSSDFSIEGKDVHDLALTALDGTTLLVGYRSDSTVFMRKALLDPSGESFRKWGVEGSVSAPGGGPLELVALQDTSALLSFAASSTARFCIVNAADELKVTLQPGCDDADVTEEHEALAASAVHILPSTLGLLAIAVGAGEKEGSGWLTQLDTSALLVQWGVVAPIEVPSAALERPLDAVSVGSDGELMILFGTSGSLSLWCGAVSEDGTLQGNASAIPGVDKLDMDNAWSAKIEQLATGTVLVTYSQTGGPTFVRFASCQKNNVVQFGPTTDTGHGSVLSLLSVPISDAYGIAALASSAGLMVMTDFRCQAGGNTMRYDITRCDGTKPGSRCELQCAAEAVGTSPTAECYEDGGQFDFEGCAAPRCVLPTVTKEHRGFDFSDCNTTLMGPLRAEDCLLKCRSGAAGALAVCNSHLADFQLAGCKDAECNQPADTKGYDASLCDTSDGPLPAWLCQISCAANYSGTELEVTCVEAFEGGPGVFDFTGCKGKCPAPTGIENAAWPSCNGSFIIDHQERCNAVCLPGYEPQPRQLRCVNGRLSPQDFECRENFCEAPAGVEHAPDYPCETGQLILPNQPCDTICDSGYLPTIDQLWCSKGYLSPPSHTCMGKNCTAPEDVAHAKNPPCREGQEISHLTVCTGACEDGYTAFPKQLFCNASKLQPPSFFCGKNCDTPTGIEHAVTPACDTGDQILHGQNCIPQCEEGYTPLVNEMAGSSADADAAPRLRCDNGDLVPAYFSCAPKKCDAPEGIELAANPACAEGWTLGHGQQCTAQCLDGFAPEPPFLDCRSMVLEPKTFVCEASKCSAPTGIPAADLGSSCAEGLLIPHEHSCTPRCQFGHAPSELLLSCVHGELQPRTFECRSVTHISPPGVAAISLAPLSNPQNSIANQAVVTFIDSHAGLRARRVRIRDGAVDAGHNGVDEEKDDISLEARGEGNEVLPRSLVLLPSGGQVLAVYARRQICGAGRIEIVALTIGSKAQGKLAFGNKVQLSTEPTALLPALLGASLGNGLTAIVTTSGISCVARVDSGSQVRFSALSTFRGSAVRSLAIAALGSRELFLVYTSESCVKGRRGTLQGSNAIQWVSDEDVRADDACLEPGALALAAVATSRVMFVAGSPRGKGTGSIITSTGQGTDWGRMEPLVQPGFGSEPILEVACAVMATGAQAPALVVYRQGSSVHLHLFTIFGTRLEVSSAQRQVSSVSSIPLSVAMLGPRVTALVYTDSAKSWQGAARVFADHRCSLPDSLVGYDTSGCEGSATYASRCRLKCMAPHSGHVQTSCSEDGTTFGITGCMPPCDAPEVESSETPSCLEGEFIMPGSRCTSSCLPGYMPTIPSSSCMYENGVSKLSSRFSCVPSGCAAPTCIKHAAYPSCAEGWYIRHGAACMPDCQPGYIPSVHHLACEATTLTPSTFACERIGTPCSVDSLLVEGAADPPCLEGTVILDGAFCTPLCDREGRVPTVEKLSCAGGELTPSTFECAAPCLAPTAVPNSLAPPCKEGFRVSHGQVCTLECKFGYQAQPTTLTCNRGVFEEDTGDGSGLYTCVLTAKSCNSPQSVLHLNLGDRKANASEGLNFCREGAVIAHGSECNAQCEFSSYSADPAKLFCNDGLLTPPTFRCGRICDAGTLLGYVRNSRNPVCKGDIRIRHSDTCIPNCKEGFTGTVGSLECFDGLFTPPGFECVEIRDGCEAPQDIESVSPSAPCLEGDYIDSGGVCTAQCEDGFMPDNGILKCATRELTPPRFSCFVLCQAPTGIANGGFCAEGAVIPHNHECTASCEPGFLPSVPSLRCEFGSLAPSTFKCHRYCLATVGVAAMYRDAEAGLKLIGDPACKEGDVIEHGSTCATLCSVGFVSSVDSLSCEEGSLQPPQFSCTAGLPCTSPEKVDDAGIPSCVEGSSVAHNSSCTPICQSGFLPSRTSLYCWNGELTPADFECVPGCAAPSDPNAPNPACAEGKFIMPGAYCTARCREYFSPTSPRLRCSTSGTGSFSPDGFTCGRDCGTPSVAFAGNPPCIGGVPVRNAQTCHLNCSKGYAGFGMLVCMEGVFVPEGPGRCLQECRAPATRHTPETHYDVHYPLEALPIVSELGRHDVRVDNANNHTLVGVLQNRALWSELEIHGMQGNLTVLNGEYLLEFTSHSHSVWKKSLIESHGSPGKSPEALYIVSFREQANSTDNIWCITEDPACMTWLFWTSLERDLDPGAARGFWHTSSIHWNASGRPDPSEVSEANMSNSSGERNRTPPSPNNPARPTSSTTTTTTTTMTTTTTATPANGTTSNESAGSHSDNSSNVSTLPGNASQEATAAPPSPPPTAASPTPAPADASTAPPAPEGPAAPSVPNAAPAPPPQEQPSPKQALANFKLAAVRIDVVNAKFTFVLSPRKDGRAQISQVLRSPRHFRRVERNMTWQLSQQLPPRSTRRLVLKSDLDAGSDAGVNLTGGLGYPFFVADVRKDSEAAAAGIRLGDELIRIGSRHTEGMKRSVSAKALLEGPLRQGIELRFAGPIAPVHTMLKFRGERLQIATDVQGGLTVRSLALGGPADLAGVRPGQYLTNVNGFSVGTYAGLGKGTDIENLNFVSTSERLSGINHVDLKFTERGATQTLVSNAPFRSCMRGFTVSHGESCTTRCNPSYLPFIKTLACNDGQLMPPSYTCVRNGNLTFGPEAVFHRGASFGAKVAALPGTDLVAMTYVDGGQLFVVVGSRGSMGLWIWGQPLAYTASSDQGHNFLNRIVALDHEAFALAFRDRSGHAAALVGVLQPAALEFSVGCEHIFNTEAFDEFDMAALGRTSRILFVQVIGTGPRAHAVLRVGHRRNSLLALEWSDKVTLGIEGVAHIAVAALDDNRAAIAFNTEDEMAGIERGAVVLVEVSSGTAAPRLGSLQVFNEAPTLHVSLAVLSGNRLAVAFLDGRDLIPETSVRLAYFNGLELTWGERRSAGEAPAVLVSMTSDGPLLVAASKSALWLAVWELHISLGKQTPLSVDDYFSLSAPAGVRLQDNTVALLLPQDNHMSTMRVASLEWTCLLPKSLKELEGYDTSECQTGEGSPLSVEECILSCAYGYVETGPLIPVCDAPPAPARFKLQGCKPQPCVYPADITNAADPSCAEGRIVESGTVCTPRCLPGYQPSETALQCKAGKRTPNKFICLAICCLQHTMRMMSSPIPAQIALEGNFFNPLSSAMNVLEDDGDAEGSVWLSASTRSTWCVMDLGATYFLHDVFLRNTYSRGWSTSGLSVKGSLHNGDAADWRVIYSGPLKPGFELQTLTLHQSTGSLRIRFVHIELLDFTGNGGGLGFLQLIGVNAESSREGIQADQYPQCAAKFLPQSSCPAPKGITNAKQPSCVEGKYVRSGSTCKPACQVGYMRSIASLLCINGRLEPALFSCIRADTIQEVTGSKKVTDDSAFLLLVDFGMSIADVITEETRAHLLSRLSYKSELYAGLFHAIQEALSSGGGHVCMFEAKSSGSPMMNDTSAVGRLLASHSADGPDLNVSLRIVVENQSIADPIVNRISSVVTGGEVAQFLESELERQWLAFLNASHRQQLLGGGWLEIMVLDGLPALTMQVLTPALVSSLSEEFQEHILEHHPELKDMVKKKVAAKQDAEEEEAYDDTFFRALLGPAWPIIKHFFGDWAPVVVSGGLFFWFLFYVVMPPSCYYWWRLRHRPRFKPGNPGERQFRAIYIVPESHRYGWRMGRLKCRCGCRKYSCRCCCCCCCCRRRRNCSAWCPTVPQQMQTCCSLCCIPCLRVPETWHVAGQLNYWFGVGFWYFLPCGVPCLGVCMRIRLRKMFAMPSHAIRDCCAWYCCWFGAALQEALHVDGAAEALIEKSTEADDQDRKMKRDMELNAHKIRTLREAARRKAEEKELAKNPPQQQMLTDEDEHAKHLSMLHPDLIGKLHPDLLPGSEGGSSASSGHRSSVSKSSKKSTKVMNQDAIANRKTGKKSTAGTMRSSLSSWESAEPEEGEEHNDGDAPKKKKKKRKKKVSTTRRMGGFSVVERPKLHKNDLDEMDKVQDMSESDEDMYTDSSES